MLTSIASAIRLQRTRTTRRWLTAQRRYVTNNPNPTLDTSSIARDSSPEKQDLSIPGPAWLWTTVQPLTVPFRAYGRASKSRPYITQFCSSLVIYFFGDLASQYIRQRGEHPEAPGQGLVDNYDTQRPLRAICIGGISSIPSYRWFIYLSTNFRAPAHWPMSRVLSLVNQVAINQIFFAPLFNAYFFGMQCILSSEGGPKSRGNQSTSGDLLAVQIRLTAAWTRIVETVPTSWYNSWYANAALKTRLTLS